MGAVQSQPSLTTDLLVRAHQFPKMPGVLPSLCHMNHSVSYESQLWPHWSLALKTFPAWYMGIGLCLLPQWGGGQGGGQGEPSHCVTFGPEALRGQYQWLVWWVALALIQVTGLDGNYRITCHTVMEVLREHKDSVMAVLEAFVYDPLLNWRLMDSEY